MELFKLLGTIAVDNAEANDNIDETKSKASGLASKMKSGISTAAKWGAGIASGASAAATGILTLAKNSASAADNIDKMSQKIGISREAYQELDFICSQSGTSVDMLQAGMKTLTAQMDKVTEGNADAIANFEKLGISVTNADGSLRNQEDVLFDTLTALQGVENQTEKSRLATELFGRSGTELMPLLNGATGSIEDMKKMAHELGLVLDDETIDSGVELTDTLDQLERGFSSIVVKVGAAAMPTIKKFGEKIRYVIPYISEFVLGLKDFALKIIDPIKNSKELSAVISTVSDVLSKCFSSENIKMVSDIAQKMVDFSVALGAQVFETFGNNMEDIIDAVSRLYDALSPVVAMIAEDLSSSIETIYNFVTENVLPLVDLIIEACTEFVTTVVDNVMPTLESVMETAQELYETVDEAVNDHIIPAISSFISMLKELYDENKDKFDKIGELIGAVVKYIGDRVEAIIDIINKYIIPIINWLVDFVEEHMDDIKAVIQSFVDKVMAIVDFFTAAFEGDWRGMLEAVWDLVVAIFEEIKNVFKLAFDFICAVFEPIVEFFSDLWDGIVEVFCDVANWFGGIFTDAWELIEGAFSTVGSFFEGVWEGIQKPFLAVAEWFSGIFTDAWQGVKDVFSTGSEIFEGITEGIADVFSSVVNHIIDGINVVIAVPFNAINGLLNEIRSVEIPIIDVKPFSGLWDKDPLFVPEIPKLEKGGVLEKGEIGLLEGNGAEAVVPLEKNQKWINNVAEAMQNSLGGEKIESLLIRLAELLESINDKTPEALEELLAAQYAININKREFGRLVKEVN